MVTQKLSELKIRYQNNEITVTAKKEKIKKMGDIQAYKSVNELPKTLVPG